MDGFVIFILFAVFCYFLNFSTNGDFGRIIVGLFPREFEALGMYICMQCICLYAYMYKHTFIYMFTYEWIIVGLFPREFEALGISI
jgi:hypothetical protein